jgi:hypothetical protein
LAGTAGDRRRREQNSPGNTLSKLVSLNGGISWLDGRAITVTRLGRWRSAATQIESIAEGLPAGGTLQIRVAGETLDGNRVSKLVNLPLGPSAGSFERLSQVGIEVRIEDGKVFVDNLVFGSPAELSGLDFDWEIKGIQVEASRPPKQLMFIPALILLGLIIMLQRGRRSRPVPAAA